ncbi:MAG TPA: hypothetical protein VES39_00305 [Rhodospirillales bacterium]|nr:hypothetical protein [Rhodospirillales bacterium]
MLETIARTPVTVGDLLLALEAVAALPEHQKHGHQARTAAVARALARRGPHAAHLLAAIHVRLVALARLRMAEGFVADGTLGVAATLPLVVNGDRAWFDAKAFQETALGLSPGSACAELG